MQEVTVMQVNRSLHDAACLTQALQQNEQCLGKGTGVIRMLDDKQLAKIALDRCEKEIERAIRQVKRPKPVELDKRSRREWHRAAAVSKWPRWRQERYSEWRRKRIHGLGKDRPHGRR